MNFFGGLGGCGASTSHLAGSGGTGGSGGIITALGDGFNILSYNGCRLTTGTFDSKAKENEALIYAQQGIGVANCEWENNGETVKLVVKNTQRTITPTNYINSSMENTEITFNSNISFLTNASMASQGVGSGAGYIEIDNGTFNGTYVAN